MNKKVILISLIVILCTISISGCINPIDEVKKIIKNDGDVDDELDIIDEEELETVTHNGLKFSIPKGYNVTLTSNEEPQNKTTNDETIPSNSSLILLEKGDKSLCIFIDSFESKTDLNKYYDYLSVISDSKKINGIRGLYYDVTTDGVTNYHFIYIEDDYLVELMTNDTADVMEEAIIGRRV